MKLAHSTKKLSQLRLSKLSSQKKNKSQQKKNIKELLNNLSQRPIYNTLNIDELSELSMQSSSPPARREAVCDNQAEKGNDSDSSDFSLSLSKKKKIHFQLLSREQISIEFEPSTLLSPQMKAIVEKENGTFNKQMKLWIIPFEAYDSILEQLTSIKKGFSIKKIPRLPFTVREQADFNALSIPNGKKTIEISYEEEDDMGKSIDCLSEKLKKGLYDFQKEGVSFGIKKHGRVLLADEMGIGKTIQAISLCFIYRENWPVLIVCPSSVKYLWKSELMRWLDIPKDDVQIINQSKAVLKEVNFFIISYDLVRRIDRKLNQKQFDFVILDESHCIKNKDSLRSFYLVPIAQRAKRVLLLSGTPLLAKPIEGYTMLSILRPDVFKNFSDYGNRYCDPQPTAFGINWSGASNTKELHYLFNTLMIRRLKKDVLDQLPPKRRMRLEIDCDQKQMRKIKDFHSGNTLKLTIPDVYLLTGLAKIKGIKRYIRDLFEADVKFIIFAHHQKVLDAIEETAVDAGVVYIRIDGQVKNEERYELVNEFQSNDECKMAILSINAAATGITLTASSMVVFAELTWTPAIMIQAEDRAHRIGQKNDHLDIVYLYGKNTIDDFIYQKLEAKLKIVSTTLDDIQTDWAFKKNESNFKPKPSKSKENSNVVNYEEGSSNKKEEYTDVAEKMLALCNHNQSTAFSDTASVSDITDMGLDINLHEGNMKRTRQQASSLMKKRKEQPEEEDISNDKETNLKYIIKYYELDTA